MNKDEIPTMEPGSRLDDLVAVKVFKRHLCAVHLSLYCCGRRGRGWSTGWAAMRELANHILTNEGESCNLEMSLTTDTEEWECVFALEGWAAEMARATGGDAPEAVSKAALLLENEHD